MQTGSRPRNSPWLLLGAVAAIALLFQGCGSSTGQEAVEGATSDDPIASALGYDASNTLDLAISQQRKAADHIQLCMAERGFDIYPPLATTDAFDLLDSPIETAELGYGIAETYSRLTELGSDAIGDRNRELLEGMSDAERTAWAKSLNGSTFEYPDPLDPTPQDPATGRAASVEAMLASDGCFAVGQQAMMGNQRAFLRMLDLLEDMEARIDSDPEMIQINSDWSSCMASRGYAYSAVDDAASSIVQDAQAILESSMVTQLEVAYTDQIKQDFDDLRSREISIALADQDCRGSNEERIVQLRQEYERDFVASNNSLLDDVAN